MRYRTLIPLILMGAFFLDVCLGQFRRGGRRGYWGEDGGSGSLVQTEGGMLVDEDTVRTG